MSEQKIKNPHTITIKRALISVSDKTGVVDFARALQDYGVELLSTGGTAKILREEGITVKDVSEHTGFPEIMEGRVKTLHPKIHGGILAKRDDKQHRQAMEEHGIEGIDMLVINLYPFVETVNAGGDFDTIIENIDIGGPAMIRASAKNHKYVSIVTDPQDYDRVLKDMARNEGGVSSALRQRLAFTAFSRTATYDSSISGWLAEQTAEETPRRICFAGTLKQKLRYGENPHQKAALYISSDDLRPGAARATQIQGKELSYNNLNDTDAAFELVSEFEEPAVAIIKHANPCGVSISANTLNAYKQALLCDQTSAFGGIIALNRPLSGDVATEIIERFVEVIIAPSIELDAINVLQAKKNIRVLTTGGLPDITARRSMVTRIAGGLLVQDSDALLLDADTMETVTDREPTKQELADLLFAFRVAKHVKSNAIVYAKDGATVGIGAGQMSRIDSSRIAASKAEDAAHEAGWDAPLTRGSIRDQEVIDAANERGLAMIFTGMRHFRH